MICNCLPFHIIDLCSKPLLHEIQEMGIEDLQFQSEKPIKGCQSYFVQILIAFRNYFRFSFALANGPRFLRRLRGWGPLVKSFTHFGGEAHQNILHGITVTNLRWGTSRKAIFPITVGRRLKFCDKGKIDALNSIMETNVHTQVLFCLFYRCF